MSPAEANGFALRFLSRYSDPDIDLDLINDATGYTKAGGKQLPVIAAARKHGFIG
ncbi:hypothetical protein [Paracoccus beibuensis]|uniref:hypothetical protein n=1 Tax=Paracoccus beibuensis TaxID=547602 RepID=UPI00223FB7E7|nr:hypothetical protein [Paracoccus beibuensis]